VGNPSLRRRCGRQIGPAASPRHLKRDVKADRMTPAYLHGGRPDLPMSPRVLTSTEVVLICLCLRGPRPEGQVLGSVALPGLAKGSEVLLNEKRCEMITGRIC
jgi:hypothetical protein